MGLFIVRHEHAKDRCPATDPDLGAMLLNHLSRPNLRHHGLTLQGEAVVRGEHTMYLIVESASEERLRDFLVPFAMAGTLDVYEASTCARVVASGGCAAPMPVVDDVVPAVDPEEACQNAIDAGLVVHRAHPLNCETSVPALIGGVVMPNAHFYVRNHFQIPVLDAPSWRLEIRGLVDRPFDVSLSDLRNMPSQASVVTLECAGNGRVGLDPPTPGEQWRFGAVSTAEWTGVPLVELLDRAGLQADAREVVFRGADNGEVEGAVAPIRFERSLTVDVARDASALLAYAMNGEPIPLQHGFPVRLVVPGWYGVASVKWLTEIEVIDHAFGGYFQVEKYQFEGDGQREPVALQRVRALVTDPDGDKPIECGDVALRGVAWSGAAPIAHVDVSVNAGAWQRARLVGDRRRHGWQWWELIVRIEEAGPTSIRARATDLAGRSQPDGPEWNRHGYGNNSVQDVVVTAV